MTTRTPRPEPDPNPDLSPTRYHEPTAEEEELSVGDLTDRAPKEEPFIFREAAVRPTLTYVLLSTLLIIIIASFASLIVGIPLDNIKVLTDQFFGPATVLLGSAIGYYFGARRDRPG